MQHEKGQTYHVPFPGYYETSCTCGETFKARDKTDALSARDAHLSAEGVPA
jgi:hypothetical protein